uniref:Putative secreted protein n=1 Tax=Ixodes ricinus TaxID=34613 RepID=A0A6B0UHJ9_IXORI
MLCTISICLAMVRCTSCGKPEPLPEVMEWSMRSLMQGPPSPTGKNGSWHPEAKKLRLSRDLLCLTYVRKPKSSRTSRQPVTEMARTMWWMLLS